MAVVISMLRGVNLAGKRKVKMEALRALYESIGLRDARTLLQSGNVLFKSGRKDLGALTGLIEGAIERKFGFHSDVVLRTSAELRDVIARNPFGNRAGVEASKLLISFLVSEPAAEARRTCCASRLSLKNCELTGARFIFISPMEWGGRSCRWRWWRGR